MFVSSNSTSFAIAFLLPTKLDAAAAPPAIAAPPVAIAAPPKPDALFVATLVALPTFSATPAPTADRFPPLLG